MFKRFSEVLVIHSLALTAALILTGATPGAGQQRASIRNEKLTVSVNTDDGSYIIRAKGLERPVLVGRAGTKVNHQWVAAFVRAPRPPTSTTS
jgi:hypothetical protein